MANPSPLLRAAAVAALLMVMAACASTERRSAGGKGGSRKSADALADATTSTTPEAAAAAGPGAAAGKSPARRSSSAGGSAGRTPESGGAGAVAPGSPGAPGPGLTATEIKIGFWFLVKGNACETIGASGGSQCGTGDDDRELDALVKYVNSQGGIAGRKLVPVVYRTDVVRSDWATQAQAACTHFTEDEKVFAVVSEGEAGRPIFVPCVAKRGIPVIDPAHWPWDPESRAPYADVFYQPQRAAPERWVAAYVDSLWEQGFFAANSKIGLLRFDAGPFSRLTDQVLKPRLAAHGLRLAEDVALKTPSSVSAYGEMNAELSNAILRFRSAGIDRLLFLETMSEITLFYFPQAEAQDFRPRLGVNTMEYLTSAAGNATKQQLRGAVGIGWAPYYDVRPEHDPGGGRSALCKEILTKEGVSAGSGRNPKCDTVFFLKEVLDRTARAGAGLNASGFRQAAHGLGSSFEPAATFTAQFGPGRHQGPASYRQVYFDEPCGCFKYRGDPRPFP